MDLFKNIKELKAYTNNLTELCDSLVIHETRVKIGKFKVIQTPSELAAKRLHDKLHTAIHEEQTQIADACVKIEAALQELQCDIFESIVTTTEPEENTLKFGSKAQ